MNTPDYNGRNGKEIMFETAEDVNTKLGGSVCLYKGEPIYVLHNYGSPHDPKNLKIEYVPLPYKDSNTKLVCSVWDENLDYRSLSSRLGYLNATAYNNAYGEALYLSRTPIRKSCQGLSKSNIIPVQFQEIPEQALGKSHHYFESYIKDNSFIDTLHGKYPTINQISREFIAHTTWRSRAFDRQFSISRSRVGPFYLNYRGREIAWTDDLYRFKLSKDFKYMEETLAHKSIPYTLAS